MLSKKAGRVHFHVGASEVRLQMLRDLIEKYDVRPDWLYPTHINRTDQLMREAIDLARQGCFVDIDTVDEDLPQKLRFYIENDGPPERLTLSSDASVSGPGNLYEQFRVCVADEKFNLGLILPMLTANTAEALKLPLMGKLNVGKMGDLLIMDKSSLEIREVFSSGKRLVKNGKLTVAEAFLKKSNRRIDLTGEKIKAAEKGGTKNRSAK
jgi:beta-aspartyl-dipeptidase (metallo-type)